jgi:hypothetical protein
MMRGVAAVTSAYFAQLSQVSDILSPGTAALLPCKI